MTGSEYQKKALRTANPKICGFGPRLEEGLMGLNGESGECIDILKKHMFQGHPLNREHLMEELGDVLWYMARTADALGITLDDIMEQNLAKGRRRYPEKFETELSVQRKD